MYPYIIRNPNVCKNHPELQYIVIVHSSVNNYDERLAIRNTWGLHSRKNKKPFEVIFLLGLPQSDSGQTTIEEENIKFGDIVQGHFMDTYHNLTQKAVFGLRWVTEHCMNARHVVKVDDDVILNIFQLPFHLQNIRENERKIACVYRPINSEYTYIYRSGRWRTKAFPGLIKYPFGFCPGFVILMSNHAVVELFQAAKRTPFPWMDDVYITGILAKAGNISHLHLQKAKSLKDETLACYYRNNNCPILAGVVSDPAIMELIWGLIVNGRSSNEVLMLDEHRLRELQSRSNKLVKLYIQAYSYPLLSLICVYSVFLCIYFYGHRLNN